MLNNEPEILNKKNTAMLSLFARSYPFIGNIRKYFLSNFLIGCFVALFLIVFEPFGTAFWETSNKTLKLAGFGLVSFIVPFLINIITILIISGKSREDKWNVGKEILVIVFVICCIAMGNLLYGRMLGIMPLSLNAYFGTLLSTFAIGVFPVTAHVLFKQNRLQKKSEEEALKINKHLETEEEENKQSAERENNSTVDHTTADNPAKEHITENSEPALLTLLAENEKDKLVIFPQQLLYIEAADNYCSISYMADGSKKKLLLRSSLKRIEQQISDEKIVRCHRAFIVNLVHVKKVEGNAAGYRLVLHEAEEHIPVSRNYAAEVLKKI